MSAVEYPPGWTCERVTGRLERYLLGNARDLNAPPSMRKKA